MTRLQALPGWVPWLLLRLTSGVITVVVLSVVVFVATHALPSDPARVVLGPDAPDETVAILRQQLGLDQPLYQQYVTWVSNAFNGDLGTSLDSRRPVAEILGNRLGNTLTLLVIVTACAAPIALGLGVLLGANRDSRIDRFMVSFLIGVKAVPSFAVGIALVVLFATSVFRVLPAVSLLDPSRPAFEQPRFLVLPVLTMLVSSLPYPVRLVRAAVIEALEADYVLLARLRGIPERRILRYHVLPNAVVPAIQGAALMLSVMFGGSVVVEVLFNYPGFGSLMNSAVDVRDLPVIQALVVMIAAGVVLINSSADFICLLLTPRLRTASVRPFWHKWSLRLRPKNRVHRVVPKPVAREAS